MDLVFDIDKVLDEFELNENNIPDENKANTTSGSGISINKQNNENDKQIKQLQSATSSSSTSSKNFVNVSNVFSSLNEYVNAGYNLSDDKNKIVTNIDDSNGLDDEQSESLPKDDCESETQSSKLLQDESSNSSDTHQTLNNKNLKKIKTKKRSKTNRKRKSSKNSTSSSTSLSHSTSPPSSRTLSTSSSEQPSSTSGSPTSSLDEHQQDSKSNNKNYLIPVTSEQNLNNHNLTDNNDSNQLMYSSMSKTNTMFSSSSSYCYNENNSSSVTFSNDIVNLDETSSLSSLINISNNLNNKTKSSGIEDIVEVEEDEDEEQLRAIDENFEGDDDDEITVDDKPIEQPHILLKDNNKLDCNPTNDKQINEMAKNVIKQNQQQEDNNRKVIGFDKCDTELDVSDGELESYLQEFEFESMSQQGQTPNIDIIVEEQNQKCDERDLDLISENKIAEEIVVVEVIKPMEEEKEQRENIVERVEEKLKPENNFVEEIKIDSIQNEIEIISDISDSNRDTSGDNNNKDEKIDNISQASTIECNEIIQSHTDLDEEAMKSDISDMIIKITNIKAVTNDSDTSFDDVHSLKPPPPPPTISTASTSAAITTALPTLENLDSIHQSQINTISMIPSIITTTTTVQQEQIISDETIEVNVTNNEDDSINTQPKRPNTLNFPTPSTIMSSPGQTPQPSQLEQYNDIEQGQLSTSSSDEQQTQSIINDNIGEGITAHQLGKIRPYWIPDNKAVSCMFCNTKFSIIKRRHHCRGCGKLLCSTCCSMKGKLEYLGDMDARICIQCDVILNNRSTFNNMENYDDNNLASGSGSSINPPSSSSSQQQQSGRSPNPNNPMSYCSVIPPHQQVSQLQQQQQISVMVPVGTILKREGAQKNRQKNVMFSDGIRPGCDLSELDSSWDTKTNSCSSYGRKSGSKRVQTQTPPDPNARTSFRNANIKIDEINHSYIPKEENGLPPIFEATSKTDYKFIDTINNIQLINRLQQEEIKFAIQRNFFVHVRIIQLSCCINKTVINFTTQGLRNVGQDEIIILLELDNQPYIPKDIFLHLNDIYLNADKGITVTDLGFSMPQQNNFLGSKEHGGFIYIRPTFQCLQSVILPEAPYLIGLLIHKWEVPWAKVFPLRLMLRLGALYRYYPSPHISERGRDSVYAEIAQTLINFLADFRTYSYTLATIRGMSIHMEDRKTTVRIPRNRYDQVIRAINFSSDHILAVGGNFSKKADGHLVCIQNTESGCPEMYSYSTQAINIQGQPRKITGASFLVLNGALKTTSQLSGKCSIVEDGLMVQILPAKMIAVRDSLKNMKDIDIICGPIDATPNQTETVSLIWTENDLEFNLGVTSPIDKKEMDGIPSIRVHKALDFSNNNHMIRWTEVFILKSDEESARDPVDISKTSEKIARSAATALVIFLDLLAANDLIKIGLRVTLDAENVCYEAGSQYNKLPPLYMNAMDNELIPTLNRLANSLQPDTTIILELIFNVLDK